MSLNAGTFGWPTTTVLRPLLGLFHGERGGKRFKDRLCLGAQSRKLSVHEVLDAALEEVPLYVLDAPADCT